MIVPEDLQRFVGKIELRYTLNTGHVGVRQSWNNLPPPPAPFQPISCNGVSPISSHCSRWDWHSQLICSRIRLKEMGCQLIISLLTMNFPAASHGELNPADFAISHHTFIVICVICLPCEMRSLFLWGEICGLKVIDPLLNLLRLIFRD